LKEFKDGRRGASNAGSPEEESARAAQDWVEPNPTKIYPREGHNNVGIPNSRLGSPKTNR